MPLFDQMCRRVILPVCLILACDLLLGVSRSPAQAEIKLIGTARLVGTLLDRSELTDALDGGVPHNLLGGISAIEYTGSDREYLLQPDRGPGDGATPYYCRFHVVKLDVDAGPIPAVTATIQKTTLVKDEEGRQLTGSAAAIDKKDDSRSLRFDPEAVRTDRHGKIFMSDEYGPNVYAFSESGRRTAILPVPSKFKIARPSKSAAEEGSHNKSGRQPNGGLEGLAIIPDGTKLYAIMQRPLIQDSRAGQDGEKRTGTNNRIIEFDLATGTTREFLYPLDDTKNGVCEILAINAHEFLVLERDGKGGPEAAAKKIYKIDLAGATDISGHETLPADGIPPGVTAARKAPFLDLLDPKFGLAGSSFPEKIEGLAFGPDLPDGRRLLIVAIDNDFIAEKPIILHAFAIDRSDLPGFGW